jgi:succinylglutamate desuccinylase
MQLNLLNSVPQDLLDVEPYDLHRVIASPTLLELPGKHENPLFVSVLLHGNEPTGFKAIQLILKKYNDKELPRSLAIFFGNIDAAKHNLRRLDKQPDYNRIWPGTDVAENNETKLVKYVFERMKKQNVFASIDIHNNTGLNPHYACVNRLENSFLHLALLFGRLVVHFTRPKGVQSAAFASLCPAVTLECGRPDQPHGIQHAFEYVDSCLHLSDFPHQGVHPQDIDLFHTVAQIKIAEQTSFSFTDIDADLLLDKDLERMNFTEVSAGTILGLTSKMHNIPLIAEDESGNNVTDQYFRIHNDRLEITRQSMPSMLTLNEHVIKQDCFCYLMERIELT